MARKLDFRRPRLHLGVDGDARCTSFQTISQINSSRFRSNSVGGPRGQGGGPPAHCDSHDRYHRHLRGIFHAWHPHVVQLPTTGAGDRGQVLLVRAARLCRPEARSNPSSSACTSTFFLTRGRDQRRPRLATPITSVRAPPGVLCADRSMSGGRTSAQAALSSGTGPRHCRAASRGCPGRPWRPVVWVGRVAEEQEIGGFDHGQGLRRRDSLVARIDGRRRSRVAIHPQQTGHWRRRFVRHWPHVRENLRVRSGRGQQAPPACRRAARNPPARCPWPR